VSGVVGEIEGQSRVPRPAAADGERDMRPNPSLALAIFNGRRMYSECLALAFEGSAVIARVGRCWEWSSLPDQLKQSPPDVLLIELDGAGADVLSRVKGLAAAFPRLNILVVGADAPDDIAAAYVAAGATACVPSDTSLRELVDMVESVARGETPRSPRLAFQVFSMVAALSRSRAELSILEYTSLTMRQIRVLRLLGQRLSDRQIAEHLGVSFHTVKNHVHRILEKLHVRSRAEALRVALAGDRAGPDRFRLLAAACCFGPPPQPPRSSLSGTGPIEGCLRVEETAPLRLFMITGDSLLGETLLLALRQQESIEVVGVSTACPDSLTLSTLAAHIVLLDAIGRCSAASSIARAVSSLRPDLKLVAVGVAATDDAVLELIEAGVSAWVRETDGLAELLATLRKVARQETACSPATATRAFARLAEFVRGTELVSTRSAPLTPRQLEVLRALAGGLSNKEISGRCGITVSTVKNHIHSIMQKLEVKRRRDAVRWAHRTGILLAG